MTLHGMRGAPEDTFGIGVIVGTLRTLAGVDPRPAAVLTGLNRRLLGRTRGGFVTCIAIHVSADRTMRLASAGHLSPFIDDTELTLPATLPHGITPDLDVEDETQWLRPEERLTLYTDGLLEARNARRELYGFDRVAKLFARRRSVDKMVITACNFGQDDDITVLTLMLSPVSDQVGAQALSGSLPMAFS